MKMATGACPLLVLALLHAAGAFEMARAEIYLNEVVVRGTERIELYNSGPDPVPLGGWELRETGVFVIPDGTVINAGEYLVLDDLGGIMHDIGGDLDLIDDLKSRSDRVQYGDQGGAPLPHDAPLVSMSRAPDASALPPLDPAADANFWTIDLNATFGAANDVLPPVLGSSLVINELDPNGGGLLLVGDNAEVFNPTGATVLTGGWFMTFGNGSTAPVTFSFVLPNDVASMKLPADIDLDETKLAYLFDDMGVRVDQLGWNGPLAARGDLLCIGRCPNGAGPNDGYDAATSGGGDTLFELECSIGARNPEDCSPTPVKASSWGRIKAQHRR
jgi:hypothetical protein